VIKKLLLIITLFSLLFAKCKDRTFSITFTNNIPLKSALLIIAKECHYSIVYTDDKTKKIVESLKLPHTEINKKTIDDVLDTLISKNNLFFNVKNDVLSISYIITKIFKINYIDSTRIGSSNTDVTISGSGVSSSSSDKNTNSGTTGVNITTEERFDFWQDLEENLIDLINRPEDDLKLDSSPVIVNPKSGLIAVSGTKRQLSRVEKYINKLSNSLNKQVLIDIKIISVTLDKSHKIGIDWSDFSLNFSMTNEQGSSYERVNNNGATTTTDIKSMIINKNAKLQMSGFFNFLKQFGETKSLSNPKVIAINNQPTMISVGDNINYLIKTSTTTSNGTTTISQNQIPASLFIGVLLDITAQIDDNDFITLRINPSISEFKYSKDAIKQTDARVLPPDTVSRRISTVVRVKNGSSIILGGLISSTKGEQENKVRILGDIPFIGRLFRSTTYADITTEIVFVLTPKVISNDINKTGFRLVQ